jgi:hypothetical protein
MVILLGYGARSLCQRLGRWNQVCFRTAADLPSNLATSEMIPAPNGLKIAYAAGYFGPLARATLRSLDQYGRGFRRTGVGREGGRSLKDAK